MEKTQLTISKNGLKYIVICVLLTFFTIIIIMHFGVFRIDNYYGLLYENDFLDITYEAGGVLYPKSYGEELGIYLSCFNRAESAIVILFLSYIFLLFFIRNFKIKLE